MAGLIIQKIMGFSPESFFMLLVEIYVNPPVNDVNYESSTPRLILLTPPFRVG